MATKKLIATKVKVTANVPKAAKPPTLPTGVKPPPLGTFKPMTPAPAAIKPPETAPLPPDASYKAQMDALDRTRSDALGALGLERTTGLSDYGYTQGLNAGDQPVYDPTNPFSKATMLKQTYDQQRHGAAQTGAARGQMYSGAFQGQQDLLNRGQLQDENTLQKSLLDFLARNSGARTAAENAYSEGTAQAGANMVGRAQDNPLYSPTYDNTATPDNPNPSPAEKATNPMAQGKVVVKKSPANGNKMWRYRVRPSDGQLIPIGPA